MSMKNLAIVMSSLVFGVGCVSSNAQSQIDSNAALTEKAKPTVLDLIVDMFPGEYNNHEQVLYQKYMKEENVFQHVHHLFQRVDAPEIGKRVIFTEQKSMDSGKVFRRRLYVFEEGATDTQVRMDIYKFMDENAVKALHLRPEDAKKLVASDVTKVQGCSIYWEYDEASNTFNGETRQDACKIDVLKAGDDLVAYCPTKSRYRILQISDQN